MQPGEMQFGEMQHFNTTPPGEIQFGEIQLSPNLFMQYNIDIFAHGTSKISSNCGYQVFITRTYVKELDNFEKGISNTSKKVFPDINIKYCERLEYKYNYFLEFLEYFEITYLKDYEIKYWNYYDDIEHITINASELFNNYLNDLFPKKISFLYIFINFKKTWEKKNRKKLIQIDEIHALIKYYKNMEISFKEEKRKRNKFVELWLKCLRDLNINIIN
ncbi:hypothetical protein H8356DRAFT_1324920 [Neocallimastix lanati (nom. inval.)]|nr:hypothetical protein H8356DRAFT_1324920 [Neocallimastix sp. JGI-2020a]